MEQLKVEASLTSSKTEVWLIGQLQDVLPANVLLTTSDVLKVFCYHHTEKKTVSESAKLTLYKILELWDKARIPTTYDTHVIEKLKSVFEEYQLIKKNKGRASDAQRLREKNFEEKSRKLFDIAHQEAAQLIKIHEDRVFLEDQRSTRQMKKSGIDKQLSKKEDRAGERKQKDEDRKMREEHRKNASAQSSITKIPDSSNSESEENIEEQQQHKDKDYEIEIPLYYKKQLCYAVDVEESSELDIATKKPRILQDMLSPSDDASALDRINLSDRKFTILAAAIAQASGQSLDDAALSRSTVHQKRLTHRSVIESHVREQFLARDKTPLLGHCDSKIMKDTTNNTDPHSNTDRVVVVVTAERSYIPREDYKEMIQLCLTVLGCPVNDHDQANSHYCFRDPGAYHMARWMAKVIYCLKIFLFRDEFKLTVSETKNLTEFCVFATAWISCPMQSDAPFNDLQLLARIDQYSEINKKIATAATKKITKSFVVSRPRIGLAGIILK
ncbi:hypothetical protein Bpfe_005642 [Biomphalaria pfeifferi]|uniref:Uncharacterized protein n=1 Tax=Biomphalaria pfeifferi TaxID=112525 RepID=A0AAD8C257_BIOPF|nr:hypothetical protein Bpfe_005642 [Biomphalaria pfeifferi]